MKIKCEDPKIDSGWLDPEINGYGEFGCYLLFQGSAVIFDGEMTGQY